jgi:hypothetical protein
MPVNAQTYRSNASEERGTDNEDRISIRTAFVARFIVLREGKRSKAHRKIEHMRWHELTSARDLALAFKILFSENGDREEPVDRDLRRALAHAERSFRFFKGEYAKRATLSFAEALIDYERSNMLLFGTPVGGRPGGWRPAREVTRENTVVSVPELLAFAGTLSVTIAGIDRALDDEEDDVD